MKEIHLTKKDFKIEWFSGTGGGGQHRNKHQNCCRITHIETGITAVGTSHRERVSNQREAFTTLANRVVAYYRSNDKKTRYNATEVIRNYHAERNEVHDKASGLKQTYKQVVIDAKIGDMIEARLKSIGER